MEYVLITYNDYKFFIDDENYKALVGAINKNDKAFLIQKYQAVIPLHITPTVLPVDIWIEQENKKLNPKRKKICSKCYEIIDFDFKCLCQDIYNNLQLNIGAENPVKKETIQKMNEYVRKFEKKTGSET